MRLAFEPWKSGVTGEEFRPAFERLRNFDAELKGTVHDGRAGVRGEDVRPEFSAGVFAANIHHESDRFAALRRTFAGEAEDDVERWANTGFRQFRRGLING